MRVIWKKAFLNKYFFYEFTASIFVLIIVLLCFSNFVQLIEARPGIILPDPFLNSFNAINLSSGIFIIIYGAILGALSILSVHPEELVILLEAYSLMVLCRVVMMYLMPLAPPVGMILLRDPFVELFGKHVSLTKDLFFSGHTASLSLLLFTVPKRIKWLFLILTLLVASGVLIQKTHYTIDVLVAPFISFGCYYLTSRFRKKLIHV